MIGILAVIAIVLLVLYFLTGAVFTIGGLIVAVIVWAIIGWLAGQIMRGEGYGAVGNTLLGLVGGLVGGILFNLLNIDLGGIIGSIIVGVVGSVIVIAIGRMLQGRRVTTA